MTKMFPHALRFLGLGVFLLFIVSCKSKKIISDGSLDKNFSSKTVIKAHYQNQLDFKTLNGKLKINYSNGESSQSVGLSLRIRKDEVIWMSAPLGIVKAYITSDRVSFYNKLENTYFDGDFSFLSQLLGTELDFEKVQNLLLGQALLDLRENKYNIAIKEKSYELKPKKALDIFKILFQIEPKNYKIASQQLSQPSKKRLLDIQYKNYQKVDKWVLPNEVFILAEQGSVKNTIDLEYKNMEFDRALRFPYKIPKGFKEIVLKKDDI